MEFNDPVVSGTILIRPAIQSPDYVAGVSGWAIFVDGTVEFNDATLRGRVVIGPSNSAQIIIEELNGAGIIRLVTNGPTVTPVDGELRATEFSIGPGIPPNQLTVALSSPSDDGGIAPAELRLTKIVGGGTLAEITADAIALGGATSVAGALTVAGAVSSTRSAQSLTALSTAVTGDTSLRLEIPAGGLLIWGSGSAAGDTILGRSAVGVLTSHPIRSVHPSTLSTTETWQPFVFQNGWANTGNVGGQYQKTIVGQSVEVIGDLTAIPATKADGTTIMTFALGYRPVSTVTYPISARPVPAGTMNPLVQIDSSGAMKVYGLTALTQEIYFGFRFPLDAV